jgi:formate-nitrite transporter family protein
MVSTVDRDGAPGDEELSPVFDRTVDEGQRRLTRTWPGLLATGWVGGMDVGIGVMALALVKQETGSAVLGSLAFGIGFIALALAGSELFTENFLVPIAAIVAGRARLRSLLRLWAGTLCTNLLGGWVFMLILVTALPRAHPAVLELGRHFTTMGLGAEAFSAAILAGGIMTLMTWMEGSSESDGAHIVAAVIAAFLLALGGLNHAVVMSLEMFGALQVGAPFGYLAWAKAFLLACAGNMVGGIAFVTVLRLIQVGREKIDHERMLSEKS